MTAPTPGLRDLLFILVAIGLALYGVAWHSPLTAGVGAGYLLATLRYVR